MIYCPEKYIKPVPNINKELMELEGELSDTEAKITLAKFLRHNLGLTFEMIAGMKLAAFQEAAIKGWFLRNFNLAVWGRGLSKSTCAAAFSILYEIFFPGTKIILAGPTFRTARNIFTEIERISKTREAKLLAQAFGVEPPSHKNDVMSWNINSGSIRAIPLSGEKVRGFRADVLIIDEFLLLSEDVIKIVLMPFLVAADNITDKLKIQEMEDELIKKGAMKEEDRMTFASTKKLIALSSASYTFENLYKTYQEWISYIMDKEERSGKYFVSQLGYQAVPPSMIEPSIVQEAQNGGLQQGSFLREYCAQFTDGSEGYFSAKKMIEQTIGDFQEPRLRLAGDNSKKYILAIDPSFSSSESSDYFAMSVLELDEEDETATLVHCYAVAGGNLKDHIAYFYYLVTHFNIVLIISDNADGNFIDAANESQLFQDSRVELRHIEEWDVCKVDSEYADMLRQCKKIYNLEAKKICIKFLFNSDTIRRANEHLQYCIDYKKVWFGSHIEPDDEYLQRCMGIKLPLDILGIKNNMEIIENQDEFVDLTKKQCALIEVKSTAKGTQTFDLPQHLKRSTAKGRARKDLYSSLMIGVWGAKCYFDLHHTQEEAVVETFTPFFLK